MVADQTISVPIPLCVKQVASLLQKMRSYLEIYLKEKKSPLEAEKYNAANQELKTYYFEPLKGALEEWVSHAAQQYAQAYVKRDLPLDPFERELRGALALHALFYPKNDPAEKTNKENNRDAELTFLDNCLMGIALITACAGLEAAPVNSKPLRELVKNTPANTALKEALSEAENNFFKISNRVQAENGEFSYKRNYMTRRQTLISIRDKARAIASCTVIGTSIVSMLIYELLSFDNKTNAPQDSEKIDWLAVGSKLATIGVIAMAADRIWPSYQCKRFDHQLVQTTVTALGQLTKAYDIAKSENMCGPSRC